MTVQRAVGEQQATQQEAQALFNQLGGQITPDEIRGILEARAMRASSSRTPGGQANGSSPTSLALDGADRAPAPQVPDQRAAFAEWQRHENMLKDLYDRLQTTQAIVTDLMSSRVKMTRRIDEQEKLIDDTIDRLLERIDQLKRQQVEADPRPLPSTTPRKFATLMEAMESSPRCILHCETIWYAFAKEGAELHEMGPGADTPHQAVERFLGIAPHSIEVSEVENKLLVEGIGDGSIGLGRHNHVAEYWHGPQGKGPGIWLKPIGGYS